MKQVAIIGGGITGLALAHALTRRTAGNAPIVATVFERAPRAGGLIVSEQVDGYLIEHGPSGFLDGQPATMALIEALKLTSQLLPSNDAARRRYLYRDGRLRLLPASPLGLITSRVLSVPGSMRLACEPLIRRKPRISDESIHAFAARRFGEEAATVLADAMVSGIFGGASRQLSMRACFPDLVSAEAEYGSVVRGMLKRRAPKKQRAGLKRIGRLTSFRSGMGELVATLAAAIGDRLRLSTAVEHAGIRDRGIHLQISGGGVATADALVLTAGADTSRLLSAIDADVARDVAAIPWAPMISVSLGYPRDRLPAPLDGFGFLAPRSAGLRLLGVLWESSTFNGRAPAGHVLLRVLLGGATDAAIVDADDAMVLSIVTRELEATMGIKSPPVMTRIVRQRPGIPQYVSGHVARMAHIESSMLRHGVFIGGHLLHGVGVNACIDDASALAERIAAWLSAV